MKIIELGKGANIGGKAGNLNKLYEEFNIARGFILRNETFVEFLNINNISLSDDRSAVKEKIMKGILPEEKELLDYFEEQKYDRVIVRSSASSEDGDKCSFAGQFDSYTNTTIDSLVFNIKRCWASMFEDNVEVYMRENELESDFSFDILIQEMITSDLSGIAFSINPTNGKEEILVDITDSQCEELVSGKVNPRSYRMGDVSNKDMINGDKLAIVEDNLKKLKSIFKKEVEIEFGFKEGEFYLFQVRPITKSYFSLNDYINTEFWCCFKNNNWTLFNRSLWILGATKYKNKNVNNKVTEDVTIYYPKNEKQMRAFNGNQPPLDEITIKRHSSEDINSYIEENDLVIKKMRELSPFIKNDIDRDDFDAFDEHLKKFIRYNAILNSYEYLIGSLGQALHDSLDKDTLKNIERWRNSEDSYFVIYDDIFEYVMRHFDISIDIKKFRMYIHVQELLDLCSKKIKVPALLKRIEERERKGFVLLNLRNKSFNNKVVVEDSTIETVKNRFYELQNDIIKEKVCDGVKGHSTFKNGKIIEGEVVVVKGNASISTVEDLRNKILVCDVTTAKDIKFIKNIKALIVNNGSILCHSAIFSREFNIPCLMGCEVATYYFETGDLVLYDVDNEIVRKA